MLEELKTERLLLRPLAPADAERLTGLANNWNVAAMLARMPYPYSLDMAEGWIARQAAQRADGEEFAYAVTNGDGFIGCCGVQSHADGTHEIGYWIGEPYWNRGYASEAASNTKSRKTISSRSNASTPRPATRSIWAKSSCSAPKAARRRSARRSSMARR